MFRDENGGKFVVLRCRNERRDQRFRIEDHPSRLSSATFVLFPVAHGQDVPDTAALRRALLASRTEAAVGDLQVRGVI